MIANVKLKIINLFACPGDGRIGKHKVQKALFTEEDLEETEADIDGDTAEQRKKASLREKSRVKYEPLVMFRKDHLYKIGGYYGKVSGLFKTASKILWDSKEPGFSKGYKSFLRSIAIMPMMAKLEFDDKDVEVQSVPQITAGRSKALIIQYFQSVPEAFCELEIRAPEGSKKKLEKILEIAQGLPFGPKSRGQIEVVNISWKK